MSTRIGAIHVDLGLETARFQKGVQSAKRDAAGLGNSLKSSLGGLTKSFAIGLGSGFLAALAPMALFSKALKDIGETAALKRLADRIGLSTTSLQALQFAA